MLATLRTAAIYGVDACAVQVEVDVSFGMPMFTMVGLPDASVRESRDRVRSAIRNSGFEFPPHRITVNLAPADVRKAGAAFDLPIALGILAAQGVVSADAVADTLVIGELSLDGSIQATRGVLPVAAAARRDGVRRVLRAGVERQRSRRRSARRAAARCRRSPRRSPRSTGPDESRRVRPAPSRPRSLRTPTSPM